MHLYQKGEHFLALSILAGMVDFLEVNSVLDVGAGTGRAMLYLKEHSSILKIKGVEPIAELRNIGYQKGISPENLIDGNALKLPFADDEFDLVCEFGVLHHIKTPSIAVSEMLRVARKAVFISDSNRFGQGSLLNRFVKSTSYAMGLWPLLNSIKTRGKGYIITEGDGLSYSYSVFDDYNIVRDQCRQVHFLNTQDAEKNIYHTAGHVVMIGIKE